MRWIVRPEDGPTVGDVLARAEADPGAVAEGRVFVGRHRVRSIAEPVQADDVVAVSPPRSQPPAPRVLVRSSDFVAVDKPAGVPTIADHGGAAHALVALVAKELGVDVARVHPTSRLDRDVSGVVVLALNKKAAERLSLARASGTYDRRYVAIAARAPAIDRGTWNGPIGRARDPRLRCIGGRDAVPAATRYAVCGSAASGAALLAVGPVTGRTHQIRVHAAGAGAPLVGDRDYRGPARLTLPGGKVLEPRRIALHCARVAVPDAGGAPVIARASIPPELEELWAALGGAPSLWEVAASCALPSSS